MLIEAKSKSESQYKEISFNGDAEDEFEKYIDFLYNNSERFKEEIKVSIPPIRNMEKIIC